MTTHLALLGATGSIGASTLAVVAAHPERLSVVTLAAGGGRLDELERLARRHRPRLVAVAQEEAARKLASRLPEVEVVGGPEGILAAATHPEVDKVVAAMVGAAGLPPVAAALAAGKDVALANKEALVVAGRLLCELAKRSGARLLPVDSEHVALHQALRSGGPGEARRLLLTASGGPFRERPLATWEAIRPEEALRHPTWAMGPKITVDSATLVNKGLELVEAHHLFAAPPAAIEVVIHPQSLVHSLVEFQDGSWLAQLSRNDMIYPVQYALAFPERWANEFPRLELAEVGRLDFQPLDEARFPAVGLARAALEAGDSGPIVFNAANEVAVHAFLAERLAFPGIVGTVARTLERHRSAPVRSLEEALDWDAWARGEAEAVARRLPPPR
jgi:1-deoxy-D-xylulose-5-phosphate reductoisomerase